jgi:hypothetical protein
MQRDSQLIERSDLLAIIVEKIKSSYSEDISLLICYGSFVTGEYGGMSDIDFFFVPRTKRGYELGQAFILNQIGYDLWPVTWERLTAIANLEDQPASILMDGEALFAASDADLQRLEDLRSNFQQNLKDEALAREAAAKCLEKAKASFFRLKNPESGLFFVDAIQTVETLLTAIATMNGAYLRKGLKRIENELERMPLVPAGFLENYRKLIRTRHEAEVQPIVSELIAATDDLYRSIFHPDPAIVDPAELAGFYEEFKSTYNKLVLACDERNYESAYYAGFMVDRETQTFLIRYTGPGIFPNIIHQVLCHDFETIRASCLEHERQLIKLLEKNAIGIILFPDSQAFKRHFIGETA